MPSIALQSLAKQCDAGSAMRWAALHSKAQPGTAGDAGIATLSQAEGGLVMLAVLCVAKLS